MSLAPFSASVTTCGVEPGSEEVGDDGLLHVTDRVFTDIVASSDPRVAGTNRVTVAMELDPDAGTGELQGSFVLTPDEVDGTWEGELAGHLDGMVAADGLARGTGALEGAIAHIAFRQVEQHPTGEPACDEPLAFYELTGLTLETG